VDDVVIRGRTQGILFGPCKATPSEALACLLALFFLTQASYPASYGQFLGFFQEVGFCERFAEIGKKLDKFMTKNRFPRA
jgi:hypothetical protein